MTYLGQEVPQTWVACDACGGDGYISHRISVYEAGCGFPHDDTHEEKCRACKGLGGWIDDVEHDR